MERERLRGDEHYADGIDLAWFDFDEVDFKAVENLICAGFPSNKNIKKRIKLSDNVDIDIDVGSDKIIISKLNICLCHKNGHTEEHVYHITRKNLRSILSGLIGSIYIQRKNARTVVESCDH